MRSYVKLFWPLVIVIIKNVLIVVTLNTSVAGALYTVNTGTLQRCRTRSCIAIRLSCLMSETVTFLIAVERSAGMVHLWRQLVGCSMHVMPILEMHDLQVTTNGWMEQVTWVWQQNAICRQQRPSTSMVWWSISARYDGAVSWRHWYARTHNRNCIISGTRNQWSSERRAVIVESQ